MGQERTGSYDLFLGLTEHGLQRLIRALYLEHVAFEGLPYEYSQVMDDGRRFYFRLGLPSLRLAPSRIVTKPDGTTSREEIANAVGIELPFSNSATLSDDPAVTSYYCLNGSITLVVPLIDGDGALSLDTGALLVWLALSDDDPDADGRTSEDKLGDQRVVLELFLPAVFSETIADARAEQEDDNALLAILELGALPVEPKELDELDPPVLPTVPVLETPETLLGVDPEIRLAEAFTDPVSTSMFHLKAKLSTRALAAGTEDDPDLADVSWMSSGHDVEILLSNRLLMEEILPSQLLPRLLEVPARQLEDEIREEVIGDEAFNAALLAEVESEVRADNTFAAAYREQIRQQVAEDESFAQAVMLNILRKVWADVSVPENSKFAEASRRFEEEIEGLRAAEVERRYNATLEYAIVVEIETRYEARLDQAQRAEIRSKCDEEWPDRAATYFRYPMQQLREVPMILPLPTIMELQEEHLHGDVVEEVVTPPEDFTFPAAETPNATLLRLAIDLFPGGPGANLIRFDLAMDGEAVGYSFAIDGQILLAFDHQRGKLDLLISTPPPQVSVTLAPWVYQQATETISINPIIRVFTIGTIAAWLVDIAADSLAPGAVAGQLGSTFHPENPTVGQVLEPLHIEASMLDDLLLRAAFRVEHARSGEPSGKALIVESKSIEAERMRLGQAGSDPFTVAFQEDGPAGVAISQGSIEPLNGHRLATLGQMPRYRADNLSQADLRDPGLVYSGASQAFTPPSFDDETDGTPDQSVAVFSLQLPSGAPTLLLLWRDALGRWRAFFRTYRQKVPGVHLRLPLPVDLHLQSGWMTCDSGPGEELIRESIEIPIFLGSGQSALGSIDVGARRTECALDLTAEAVPISLIPPIESVKWTVVAGSQEHDLPLNVARILDVPDGADGLTPVTFEATEEHPIQCHMTAPTGDSGAFALRVEIVSGLACFPDDPIDPRLRATCTYRDERQIMFEGRQNTFFGYDRWLELFERMTTLLAQELEGIEPDGGDIDPRDERFVAESRYLLLDEDLSAKELLSLKPGAERASEPSPLARYFQLGGRQAVVKGVGRPLSELRQQDSVRLSGVMASTEARSFLARRVNSRLKDLARHFPKDRKLDDFVDYTQALLKRLPDPGRLQQEAERRSLDKRRRKKKGSRRKRRR